MLMIGRLDTLTASSLQLLHFLAIHPEHRDQLLEDPELIPKARRSSTSRGVR